MGATCCGSYQQIESPKVPAVNVTDLYNFGETIGSGVTCTVVEGSSKQYPDEHVSIKIMNKHEHPNTDIKQLFQQEVTILQKLTADTDTLESHNGILPLIAYGEDHDACYIVTQLLKGGELFDRILSKEDKYKMTERMAIKLIVNMLTAVQYCHLHGIIHRDLKPENFVFANKSVDSDIVLIDFGCARIVKDNETIGDIAGTSYYLAPELAAAALDSYRRKGSESKVVSRDTFKKIPQHLLNRKRTGRALKVAEVWPIGVMAFVLMTGRVPFRGKHNIAVYEAACLKPLKFPKKHAQTQRKLHLSENFKDFIGKTLHKNPKKRISIGDALKHQWLTVPPVRVRPLGGSRFLSYSEKKNSTQVHKHVHVFQIEGSKST